MGLKEKLDLIESCKTDIRNKIIDKGVYVPESTPFSKYPEYINNIEASPIAIDEAKEWTPDPLWWDIETILANDKNEGDNAWLDEECSKCIILMNDELETNSFTLQAQNSTSPKVPNAIKTSDGTLYLYENGNTITHRWNKSEDKQSSSAGVKTRYVIIYNRNNIYENLVYIHPDILNNFIYNGLYMISNASIRGEWRYDTNCLKVPSLKGIKFLGEKALFMNYYSSSYTSYAGLPILWCEMLEYFSFETIFDYNIKGFLNYAKNLKYFKLKKENYDSIDEVTGGKKYALIGCNCEFGVLDVSDVDFSECASEVITESTPRIIKGIINLDQNQLNTNYTIFKSNSTFNFGEMTFSLKLPTNADVTLRVNRPCPASAKYLVENAPKIETSHTLTVSANTYNRLKYLDREYQAIYNGETYSDGVQVLTLKGWTVTTV